MAIALHVTTDSLVFAEHERGPADDLKLAFEATTDLDPAEQAMVKQLIEASRCYYGILSIHGYLWCIYWLPILAIAASIAGSS